MKDRLSPQIIVVGSLNIDQVISLERLPVIGETVKANGIEYFPGGKGANQAVGCARLGADVLMIGALGNDAYGKQLLQSLDAHGVRTDALAIVDNIPTGAAIICKTPSNNCIAVVEGANACCAPELLDALEERIRNAKLMLVQLEIPLDTVRHALLLAKRNGIRTILNPAPAHALNEEILRLSDFLTLNETEFETLVGQKICSDAALEARMMEWERKYGHRLIVTRGEKGASFLLNRQMQTVPAKRVTAVDTTGAGDAFNAALSVSVVQGGTDLEEMVRFSSAAASLSVQKPGAQGSMPAMEEVELFIQS